MAWQMSRGLRLRMVLVAVLLPLIFVAGLVLALNIAWIVLSSSMSGLPSNETLLSQLLVVGGIVALGILLQYLFGKGFVLGAVDAERTDRESHPELHGRVKRLAQQADMSVPAVALSPSGAPNAFTVGRRPFGATVVVTEGLLETLDDDELDAILAHELAHIKNHDVSVMTLASIVPRVTYGFAVLGYYVLVVVTRILESRSAHRSEITKVGSSVRLGLWLSIPVTMTLSGLFWAGSIILITLFSRHREYAADRGAAKITGDPLALVSALRKIDTELSNLPDQDLRGLRTGYEVLSVSPLQSHQFHDEADVVVPDEALPHTHPAVGDRVSKLQDIAKRDKAGRRGKSSARVKPGDAPRER